MKRIQLLFMLLLSWSFLAGQNIKAVGEIPSGYQDEGSKLLDGNESTYPEPYWGKSSNIYDIDLGKNVSVKTVSILDWQGGNGIVRLWTGSQNNWTQVGGNTSLNNYNVWKDVAINRTTRYIRIEIADNGKVSELKIDYDGAIVGDDDDDDDDDDDEPDPDLRLTTIKVSEVTQNSAILKIENIPSDKNINVELNNTPFISFKTLKGDNPPPDTVKNPPDTSSSEYALIEDIIGVNWVIDNDEPNGGTYNRPNLIKIKRNRLYLFGGDISDGNPNNIYIDPTQGFGGKYKLSELLEYLSSNGVKVQVSLRDNPEFCAGSNAYPDGPCFTACGDSYNPDCYKPFAEFIVKLAKLLEGKAESVAIGNEFYEHWKSNFEDWDPEEIASLCIAIERIYPKATRSIKIGPAGDVAWDTRQYDRFADHLSKYDYNYHPLDWHQVHIYWNSSHATRNDYKQGIDFSNGADHPEDNGGLRVFAQKMVDYIQQKHPGQVVRIGEYGYDVGYWANGIGGQDDGSPNLAEVPGRDTKDVQAEWGIRSMLAYSAVKGIESTYWYTYDHVYGGGGGWLFGSSGFYDGDNKIKMPIWDYVMTMKNALSGYRFDGIEAENNNVFCYRYKSNDQYAYAVWTPTRSTGNAQYDLKVSGGNAQIIEIKAGSETGQLSNQSISSGSLKITVNQIPKFIKIN